MQALKKYRSQAKGVADLLNWAALIDDGIVLNKSGALMAGYFYRGPDIASSTEAERNHITMKINTVLAKLGNGWVTWHDAIRLPSSHYPDKNHSFFPDPISALIDEERRCQFLSEDAHFESEYAVIFYYTPARKQQTILEELVWEKESKPTKKTSSDKLVANFKKALLDLEDGLSSVIKLQRMRSFSVIDNLGKKHLQDDLINYLQYCLTGNATPLHVPPFGMYMDAYLGGQELWTGDTPKIGDNFIACVSIEGYPQESYPNILELLERLPIAYRWSTRMIYLDQHSALKQLNTYRRKWKQKMYGFWSQVFKTGNGSINEDAHLMKNQMDAAITDANSALVTFGYFTSTVILMSKSREDLLDNARYVKQAVERLSFACRIETINATDAWLGSLPGHPLPNIRRPLIHTLNQADLLPLSSVWPGLEVNPCPFYPDNSPPLAHTATSGSTPFRLNLHYGDIAHTLIFGPTGAGKSTFLSFITAQFRRYQGASICVFDKGYSMLPLVKACQGLHHDVGADNSELAFSPLSQIDSQHDRAWAEDWLATCYELQTGLHSNPHQKMAIHRALILLSEKPANERSLTEFCLTVQNDEIRMALSHYTISGAMGHLLDGREDGLTHNRFVVFEMSELMGMGEKNLIPVLLYLFRWFEKSLKGQPGIIPLDEAWVMLGHPMFREKIKQMLKEMRKNNVGVVLATQSLSDAANSGIFDVILESCPTKIFLPNNEIGEKGTPIYEMYAAIGLNETQINIIKNATKKRHYYYTSPEGNRLFDLGLGPLTLAFTGVSDKEKIQHIRELEKQYQAQWPYQWLQERGVDYAQYQKNI